MFCNELLITSVISFAAILLAIPLMALKADLINFGDSSLCNPSFILEISNAMSSLSVSTS